jgi:hypothetical protein
MTSNLHPDVVATPRGDDSKAFVRDEGKRRKLVLHSAQLFERLLRCRRNQLPQNPGDSLERKGARRKFHLPGRCDHIWTLADMQDKRVSVSTHDGG